jgi:hypothetical protein
VWCYIGTRQLVVEVQVCDATMRIVDTIAGNKRNPVISKKGATPIVIFDRKFSLIVFSGFGIPLKK